MEKNDFTKMTITYFAALLLIGFLFAMTFINSCSQKESYTIDITTEENNETLETE